MPITPVAPPSVTRRLHRHVASRRLNRHVNYASCTAIGYPHRDADQLWRTDQWRGQSRVATRRRTLTRSGLGRGRGWAGNAKGKKPADACAYLPARPAALPVFSMFSRSKCLVPHRGAARAVARAPPDRCCQWETPIYPAERPRPEPQLFCVLSVSVDYLGEGSVFISGISRAYLQFPRENNHPM